MKIKGFVFYKYTEHKENEFMPCVLVIKNGEIVEYESGFFKNIFSKENNSALSKIEKISKTHNPERVQNNCKYYIQHSIDGEVMNIYLDINIFQYWILKSQLKQYLIQTNGFKQAFYIALFVFALSLVGYYIKRTKIDTIQIPIENQTIESKSESKKEIKVENRTLYVFDLDSLKRTENYKLTIEIRDTLTKYKYQNLTDESKNMDVFYFPKTKILKFAMWEYIPKKIENFKVLSLSKTEFVNYEMQKPEADGTGPILFNPEYGILGIRNVMAPNFVYLKNQSDLKTSEKIIEKLTE